MEILLNLQNCERGGAKSGRQNAKLSHLRGIDPH